MKYAFVVAGTHSGVGKTTATLILLAALHEKALIVQPFKVGPDYLDPGYHNLFSGGRKSRNLDSFLLSEESVRQCFHRNTLRADVAVVEGVMGMHDGSDVSGDEGSTAHIAKVLNLPLILVVDAQGMARSAGAVVLGFKQFDADARLMGVIFNRVSGAKHYEYLRRSLHPDWNVEPLGYIPEDPAIEIPERHLGLTSALEHPLAHAFFDQLRKASKSIDIQRLLELVPFESPTVCSSNQDSKLPAGPPRTLADPGFAFDRPKEKKVRIGVAYDEAFSFYYEDNFDLLRDAGAELIFFSPLYGNVLPPDLDALYLGGGFPEMFAPKLSRNLSMIESIQRVAEDKRLIYAECGGLIYLVEKFRDAKGRQYEMVGLIPGEVEMTTQLQSFGYKQIRTIRDTFLFHREENLRSHEFHYSRWIRSGESCERPYLIGDQEDGFWSYPVLASYQHLHFGTHPSLAARFVESIADARWGVKVPQ